MAWWRRAAVLSALAAAAAGCAKTLDTSKLEGEIAKGYAEQVKDVKVRSVSCPDDLDAEAGTKGECTGRLANGVEVVFAITVTDDSGNVRWEAVRGLAPGRLFEDAATDRLEQLVGQRPAGVDCPARIALKTGTKVRCTVRADDGSKIGATLTVNSPDGDFAIAVDEAP